ncbi:LPP20 family lipoprotein [Helicobacter sp. 13S00482-2]|uniref:LPP20 family lipoprotein n=1 Tax=Helicobacter sp. 13S00482-2 TaxID=1476200 RepID=UPI002150F246|nr:LPP20 family lipoprotein [Helicobacter sp. 13S00482-2]
METISSPPKWFLSITRDNVFLYGNGSGDSLEKSKQNAINDLASSIKLKVSSNTNILNSQDNQKQDSKILQDIKVSIETIELQNIILTHTEYKNKVYYSQIKISKDLLVRGLKNQYQNLYEQLKDFNPKFCKSISIKDKNILENLLEQANSTAQSIQALDFSSKVASLKAYENMLTQNSPLPKAKLVFSPQSDPDAVKMLSSEYAKFIQNTDEKDVQTIYNKIAINTDQKEQKIKASLEVNINDCNNQTIFYIQVHSIENNKEDALRRLKIQLYKKLKEYKENNQEGIPNIS